VPLPTPPGRLGRLSACSEGSQFGVSSYCGRLGSAIHGCLSRGLGTGTLLGRVAVAWAFCWPAGSDWGDVHLPPLSHPSRWPHEECCIIPIPFRMLQMRSFWNVRWSAWSQGRSPTSTPMMCVGLHCWSLWGISWFLHCPPAPPRGFPGSVLGCVADAPGVACSNSVGVSQDRLQEVA
jgi:hypothetical protein